MNNVKVMLLWKLLTVLIALHFTLQFYAANFTIYRVCTSTDSMGSAILPGSLIIERQHRPDYEYRIGDIIRYHPGGEYDYSVVHRVVEITTGGYFTKGDNNPVSDDYLVVDEMIRARSFMCFNAGRNEDIEALQTEE